MYKLTHESEHDGSRIEMHVPAEITATELLEHVMGFMAAVGYHPDSIKGAIANKYEEYEEE